LSQGDTFLAATNPVGFKVGGVALGNVVAGSIGNDVFTSNNTGPFADYYVTEGGADNITFGAGHTAADHVGFYAAAGNATGGGNYAVAGVATAIYETIGVFPNVNPGGWGQAAGAPHANIDTLFAAGTGTSLSNSTVTNFSVATDIADFSAGSWGAGPTVTGLSGDTGAAIANVTALGLTSATGTAVNAVQVAPGGSIQGTAATPTDFIVLSQGTFLNANAVASALHSTGYNLTHSAAAGIDFDFLLAYAGIDGNTHLADLHILGGGGTTTATDTNLNVSDIATLVGVNLSQFVGAPGGVGAHVHILV
jgi:hypothetical protein